MFLEKDFACALCLSVNVDFVVGPVSSLTGTLHKAFLDILVVVFRSGVIN
jgi:hypothetical protein